jgi:CybS, succinate dehydrogenase cytochrome B small subunit
MFESFCQAAVYRHSNMFRLVGSSQSLGQARRLVARHRPMSSLEGDAGTVGTRIYHGTTLGLTVLTPLYFLTPDSFTDGYISKSFGLLLSAGISAHSWIGLNYVCRDYVPKISKKLLGPARVVTLGMSVITFLGMAKISVGSPGGLKGLVKGVWTGKPKKGADDI